MNEQPSEALALLHAKSSAALTLALTAVYFAVEPARAALTLEDQALESATAFVFAAAAVIGFVACWRRRGRGLFYWVVPLCALAGLLDEISFGHALLEFRLPELRGMPVDGLHDLFLVAYSVFETDNKLYLASYVVLAVVALAAGGWYVRPSGPLDRLRRRAGSFLSAHPPFRFLVLALLFLASALVLDLDLIESHWLLFLEELLELEVALALAFGAAAIGLP